MEGRVFSRFREQGSRSGKIDTWLIFSLTHTDRDGIGGKGGISMKRTYFVLFSLILISAMGSTGWVPVLGAEAPAPLDAIKWEYPPKFSNVTVNLVTDLVRPYESWKNEFEKAGINVEILEPIYGPALYEKEKTEFMAGTGVFDVVTFYPAFIGDFASNGYLEPLDEYMKKQPAEAWDPNPSDVLAPFWELYCKFGGKVYALPVDGDVLMLMYRKDLFDHPEERAAFKAKYGRELAPPETWEDWLQTGEFFTRKKGEKLAGKVLDRNFYGSAEFGHRGWSYAWFVNRWAAFGEPYFDENMKPLVNSPNAVRALQNFVDSLENAPPNILGYEFVALRDAFLKGTVAMVIQWTNVPKEGADPNRSHIAGRIGVGRVPGWEIGGTVVHRALMAVGRVVAVAADSRNKEAAYWVAKHVSYDRSLENVSSALEGMMDPYRKTHFTNPGAYAMFGTVEEAQAYLKGVEAVMADGYPEIFIPGAAQYFDSLDLHVHRALGGEETPEEALNATAKEWDVITEKLDRKNQIELWHKALEAYRTLGLIK
jgi:multiple sugar transport system substrate-binding protein